MPPEQGQRSWLTLDLDRLGRMRGRGASRLLPVPAARAGRPPPEPDPGSPEYQAADAQARAIAAGRDENVSEAGRAEDCPSVSVARREHGCAGRTGVGAGRRSPRRDRAGRVGGCEKRRLVARARRARRSRGHRRRSDYSGPWQFGRRASSDGREPARAYRAGPAQRDRCSGASTMASSERVSGRSGSTCQSGPSGHVTSRRGAATSRSTGASSLPPSAAMQRTLRSVRTGVPWSGLRRKAEESGIPGDGEESEWGRRATAGEFEGAVTGDRTGRPRPRTWSNGRIELLPRRRMIFRRRDCRHRAQDRLRPCFGQAPA